MKHCLKLFAVGSALCVALTGMPVFTAHADSVRKIVVIGDSIASSSESYTHYIEDCIDVQVQNFAQDAYTTADILSCLSDETVKKALSEADVILINAGEHDVHDNFLVTTANFMEEFKFEKFLDVFQARLQDYGFETEDDLLPYSNKLAAELRKNQKTANENLQLITKELDNYSNAKIIWQTAYNMLDTIEIYDDISAKRQMAYNAIMKPERTVLSEYINKPISEFADSHENCTVVDIYTEFLGNAYQYTHLYDLDFNPTVSGHKLIADKVIAELQLTKSGDVNHDDEVNAKDAASVLVHSASVGAGNGGTFSPEELKIANVNSESEVNAKDAAQILVYSACAGAGISYHFQKSDTEQSESSDPV